MNRKDGALVAGMFLLATATDRFNDFASSEFISDMQWMLGNARRKVADGRATAQFIVGTALLAHVVYTSMRDSRADATIAPASTPSPPGSASAAQAVRAG